MTCVTTRPLTGQSCYYNGHLVSGKRLTIDVDDCVWYAVLVMWSTPYTISSVNAVFALYVNGGFHISKTGNVLKSNRCRARISSLNSSACKPYEECPPRSQRGTERYHIRASTTAASGHFSSQHNRVRRHVTHLRWHSLGLSTVAARHGFWLKPGQQRSHDSPQVLCRHSHWSLMTGHRTQEYNIISNSHNQSVSFFFLSSGVIFIYFFVIAHEQLDFHDMSVDWKTIWRRAKCIPLWLFSTQDIAIDITPSVYNVSYHCS